MATMNSHTPTGKTKISDIASLFGGMAKMKKVRTPRRLRRKKSDAEKDLLRQKMEALKHVDDSKKNLFANKLNSAQNVYDVSLRKAKKERQPSPMPPLCRLPNDIANAAASLSSHTTTSCSSSSSASESEDFLSSSATSPISHAKYRQTTKEGIDLNAMRAKLRPVAKKEENVVDIADDDDDEHFDIEDNSTPKSSAVSPPGDLHQNILLNKERNESWSSNKSNEDTEIDDISSTRSNSINKQEEEEDARKKHIVITINDGENILTQNERNLKDEDSDDDDVETPKPAQQIEDIENEDKSDWNWFSASATDDASSLSSSTMSSDTDITDDDDVDGLHKHHRSLSLKHKIKKRKFGSEISLDTSEGALSTKNIYLIDAETLDDDEESSRKPKESKHKKRASSAMVHKQWDYDDLFGENVEIGAIKTPKFDKEKYKKEQKEKLQRHKPRKRASSALMHKTWNYDELFGDNVEIGAIKTPKFDKEAWKKKKKEKEKKEKEEEEEKYPVRKRASSAYAKKEWNYDDLFGDGVEIGAIKTPKFNKKEWKKKEKDKKRASSALIKKEWDYDEIFGDDQVSEREKKRSKKKQVGFKSRKRSKTENKRCKQKTRKRAASAVAKKSWNYDDLFGENVEIGAIKTPKFNKKKQEKFTPTPINTEIAAKNSKERKASDSREKAFDLRDILGDDFDFDDLSRMKRECDAIAESNEDSFFYNPHYSTSSEEADDGDDDEEDEEFMNLMGDITPATPEMPDLPSLNAHNLSISTMPRLSSIAKQPSIEMIEEGDEEEEESEQVSKNIDELMKIFSSDEESAEPQPAKSAFEIERAEYDEMEKEIENDMNEEAENAEELIRRQKKRDSEIMHDLDDLFDDDFEEEKEEEKEEVIVLKRRSFSDEMDSNEMEIENNEPLGDEVVTEADDDDDDVSSDEVSEEEEEEEEHEVDKLSLRELMCEFRMNPSKNEEFFALHEYFRDVLGINCAHELVNHIPTNITQPAICKATQTRMLLTKMAKYVTNQVVHNYWSGSKSAEWVQLEQNKLTYTFKAQRSVTTKRRQRKKRRRDLMKKKVSEAKAVFFEHEYPEDEGQKTNSVHLTGSMDQRFVDENIALNEESSVTFTIDDLPQINKKSKAHYLIHIGVRFYEKSRHDVIESVYISDRCSLHRNGEYLETLSLSNSHMIESNSQIIVSCDNRVENPSVTFSHLRNYRLYKNNRKTIKLSGFKQRDSSQTFAKIFIEQAYGRGMYSVHETIDDIESESESETDSESADDDRKKHNESEKKELENQSSIARNLEKFRRSKSRKKVSKKTRHRASV